LRTAYEVRNLRKVYKAPPVVANDGITFNIAPGEAFGLLGANGAGKSTLVKQLVGLLRPTSGEIMLFGESLGAHQRIGRAVAYLPQGSLSQGEWKVRESIVWVGMLRGLSRTLADNEAAELMAELELTDLVDRQVRKLSGGQRRLVQIAMTLVARLPILILDEPTADIDPALRRRIWKLISERAAEGAAVLLVTHDVSEAERALDRVAILDKGKLVASGTPAELKANLSHRTRLEVVVQEDGNPEQIQALLGPGATVEGRRISGWVDADDALSALDKVLNLGRLEDVRLVTPTLEDVYLSVSGHGLA
jgi:ABC-type multidrug transport system ATPase subunit